MTYGRMTQLGDGSMDRVDGSYRVLPAIGPYGAAGCNSAAAGQPPRDPSGAIGPPRAVAPTPTTAPGPRGTPSATPSRRRPSTRGHRHPRPAGGRRSPPPS